MRKRKFSKMKQYRRFSAFVLLGVITAFLVGCSKDEGLAPIPTPQPETKSEKGFREITPNDTVVMKPNVIYTRKDIDGRILSNTTDEMVFSDAPSLDLIKVGDILYSSGNEPGQAVYAKKVKQIRHEDGKVVCSVEQAMIDEVFEKFDQKGELRPSPEGIITYSLEDQIKHNIPGKKARAYVHTAATRGFPGLDGVTAGVNLQLGEAFVKAVIYDGDDQLKTKDDQLVVGLTLDCRDLDAHLALVDKTLCFDGHWNSKAVIELSYGGYSLLDEESRKNGMLDAWEKKDKDKNLTVPQMVLDGLHNKRILLVSIPTPWAVGEGKLKAGFFVDIYLLFELDLKGKLSCKFECAPINFDFSAKVGKKNDIVLKFLDPEKPKLKNVSVTGEVKAEGKLGLSTGIALKLPAFPNPKDKDKKDDEKELSYLGVFGDFYLGITAGMKSQFKTDFASASAERQGYILAHLDMNVFAQSSLEGKFFFSFIRDWELEENFKIPEKPYPVYRDRDDRGIDVDLGWIFMQTGQTYKIPPKHKYQNTKVSVYESGDKAASFKYDKDENTIFTGLKKGNSYFNLTYPNLPLKFGYYWIYVYPNGSSTGIDNIDPSTGIAL